MAQTSNVGTEYAKGMTPDRGGAKLTPWKLTAIVALSALLVLSVVIILAYQPSNGTTQVEWSSYTIDGGPNVSNNYTIIIGGHFCVPADASGNGIFSMVWSDSNETAVEHVRLVTILPPDPSNPSGVVLILYDVENSSSGGTSFSIHGPTPCDTAWIIDVESSVLVTVTAVTMLVYNVSIAHTV